MGMKSSPQNATNGAIMAVLWFVYRILFFGWLGAGLFRMRSDLMTLECASSTCASASTCGIFEVCYDQLAVLTFRTCVHIMACVCCVCVSREETERKREREREGAFLSPLLYFATV